jgi:Flp pilus assembly protein TadD
MIRFRTITPLLMICFIVLTGCSYLNMMEDESRTLKPAKRKSVKGVEIAKVLFDQGDVAGATEILDRLHKKHPNNKEVTVFFARSLYLLSDYKHSIQIYEKLATQTKFGCKSVVGLGYNHLKLARSSVAFSFFDQCLKKEKNHKGAKMGMEISRMFVVGKDADFSYFLNKVNEKPNDIVAGNNLGLSYLIAGQVSQAVVVFEQIAFQENSTARIRQNLALAYGLSGDDFAARRVGLLDLSGEQVRENLHFYAYLRTQPSQREIQLILDLEPLL